MNRRDFLKHTGAMSTASLLRQASVGTNAVALAGEMPESATPKTEDEGALCQRLEFSRNWRFFKGEANAAFQHLMLDEVRPEQGQNNWSFGVSRRAEGPREELMTLQQDYRSWGFMSAWEFSANPGCLINDGRFIPDNFPPHPYGLNLHCGEEGPWIPRVEWVSAREATADITIRGKARACTQVGDIRARILHNGRTVWESSDLKPYAQGESFNVQVSGVAKGDVLT
ncbi:MAG: hypothetical protein RLZZ303_2993, partial [Candidatus Hydrogenedentota bacterium]